MQETTLQDTLETKEIYNGVLFHPLERTINNHLFKLKNNIAMRAC